MASITIRDLEPELKLQLRVRAARRGHSMEEEVRGIMREAVAREAGPPTNIAAAIRALFRPLGGVELKIPTRRPTTQLQEAAGWASLAQVPDSPPPRV